MDLEEYRDRFEALIEGPLLALQLQGYVAGSLTEQILNEVSHAARQDSRGRSFAPDQFTLSMNPGDVESFDQPVRAVQSDLSEALDAALRESPLKLVRHAHLTLATDPTLKPGEVRIIAWHSTDPLSFAERQLPEGVEPTVELDQPPQGAFFVVAGREHFPLREPVVNIGRLRDNDLILDDRRISRRHCQLRVRDGRYVLKDLQSTAGTLVNNELIVERALEPGDVVRIAGVELIYAEDRVGPPGVTPPYERPRVAGAADDQARETDAFRGDADDLPLEDSSRGN